MWKVCVSLLLLTSWRLSPSVACTPGVPLIWKHVAFNCHVFDLSELAPNLCFLETPFHLAGKGQLHWTLESDGPPSQDCCHCSRRPASRLMTWSRNVGTPAAAAQEGRKRIPVFGQMQQGDLAMPFNMCSMMFQSEVVSTNLPSDCIHQSSGTFQLPRPDVCHPWIRSKPFRTSATAAASFPWSHDMPLPQQLPWAMPLPRQIHGSINPPNCTSFSKVPGSGKYLSFTVFVAS